MSGEARNGTATLGQLTEEFSLRSSELSYRRLFEAAQDGILILDAKSGRISDANPFLVNLLGFSRDEMLGKTVAELSPFKDIESNQAMLAQLKKNLYVRYEDLPLETSDGRQIAVEFVRNVYQAGNKEVIQCNIRDITARKGMEQQMSLLNACVANLSDIVLITESEPLDEPGPRIVFVNQAFERLTGYTAAEIMGQSPRILQGKKTDRRVLDEIRRALDQKKPIRRQLINYRKDGTEYWIDVDIVPILSRHGKCTHFAAIERDITAEKKSESQLLWKTALFEAQVNSSPDGIIVVDSEAKTIIQNQQLINLWNPPDDVRDLVDHRRRLEWITSQVTNAPEFAKKVAHLYAHPREISHDELTLLNGKIFERYTAPVLGRDGTYFGRIWTYRDITDRKKTEARFRRLVDSNAQGVIFWNTHGEITQGNDAFLRIVGYTREDLEAGKISWIALTPPEYAHLDRRGLEEIAATGSCTPYEKEYLRKDGTRAPVLLGAASFADNPKEGVCFFLDLTESKMLEQQYLRVQRMESIGTLAGGIAHDLNNILTPIMMGIEILRSRIEDPQAVGILETIEISAKRGTEVVRQILSFVRGMDGKRIEVRLKGLLNDLENIIRSTFPKDVRLQSSINADTWSILGDPAQVHQVLLNLCVNARDAMPNGGNLTIRAENAVLDAHYAAMNVQAKPGRYVHITVVDSGTGMPQAVINRIFEPFFTTKDLTKGTGLGLSTVMAIVKSHGGVINVYSEPGNGTRFNVYLPAMDASGEEGRAPSLENELPRGNGETILVADDENSILTITAQTLRAFGYQVLTAVDGAEAVAVYAEHKREISAVLTDMTMPIMDGASTIRALMTINPSIKIIGVSGLNAHGGITQISEANVKRFLTKPYTAGTLLTTIRAVLDGA